MQLAFFNKENKIILILDYDKSFHVLGFIFLALAMALFVVISLYSLIAWRWEHGSIQMIRQLLTLRSLKLENKNK